MQFQDELAGGIVLVRPELRSPNYVAGTSGWSVNVDGSAEFTNLIVRSSDGASQDVVIDDGQIDFGSANSTATMTGDHVEFRDRDTTIPKARMDKNGYTATDNLLPYQLRNTISADGMAIETPGEELLSGPSLSAFVAAGSSVGWEMSTGELGASDDVGSMFFTAGASSATLAIDSAEGNAKVKINGHDIGSGPHGYANITASTATTTSATDTVAITLSSRTYRAGRAYRVEFKSFVSSTVAADEVGMRVRKTDGSGAVLLDIEATGTVHRASQNYWMEPSNVIIIGATDVTAALVGTYFRRSGTGNCRLVASAVNPAYLRVTDIGDAADFSGATTLS